MFKLLDKPFCQSIIFVSVCFLYFVVILTERIMNDSRKACFFLLTYKYNVSLVCNIWKRFTLLYCYFWRVVKFLCSIYIVLSCKSMCIFVRLAIFFLIVIHNQLHVLERRYMIIEGIEKVFKKNLMVLNDKILAFRCKKCDYKNMIKICLLHYIVVWCKV